MKAMPARTVNKKEIAVTEKAQIANDAEWSRLENITTWEVDKVREWSEVAREARETQQGAHVGRVFCITVEKNSELEPGDPRRKYKGRVKEL